MEDTVPVASLLGSFAGTGLMGKISSGLLQLQEFFGVPGANTEPPEQQVFLILCPMFSPSRFRSIILDNFSGKD